MKNAIMDMCRTRNRKVNDMNYKDWLIIVILVALFGAYVRIFIQYKWINALHEISDSQTKYMLSLSGRINLNAKLIWQQDTFANNSVDDLMKLTDVITKDIIRLNNNMLSNEDVQLIIEEKVKMFLDAERLEER